MLHDRKSTRASVELTPRYRTPASFDYVEGRCIDLSEGGMFVVAQLPCESGTLLKFECDVEGTEVPVKGVARVVWRRTGGGEDRPSGMGLKFVKLEPGSEALISQMVSEAQAHGTTAPERPLAAHVKVTESFPPQAPSDVLERTAAVSGTPIPSAESASAVNASISTETAHASSTTAQSTATAHAQPKPPSEPSGRVLQQTLPAPADEDSGTAIWFALAVGAALLIWLLFRSSM